MNQEPKACPFCGSSAISVDGLSVVTPATEWSVTCLSSDCYASTAVCDTREEAIEAWNRRASSWIPVEREFPKETGDYLTVALIQGERHICKQKWFAGTPKAQWYNVTHWQHLPELP